MRKVKVINIEGRGEVTVKEITPLSVIEAWQKEGERLPQIRELFDDCVTPGFDTVKTWYPSEQEQVLKAFLEVNDSFFSIARLLKVDNLAAELAKNYTQLLPKLFSGSLLQDLEAKLGATAGQPLSLPSNS